MSQFWTACCQPAGLKCSVFSFEWKSQVSYDWCAAVTLHDEEALQQLLSTYNKRSGFQLGSKNHGWLRWTEPWFPARFDSAKKGKKGIGGKGAEGYRQYGGGIAGGGQGAGKGVPFRHREPEPWQAGIRTHWDAVEEGRAKGRKYAEFDGTGNGGDWWRGMAQGSGIGGKGTGGDGKSGDGKSIGKGIGGGEEPGRSGDGSAGGKEPGSEGGAQGTVIAEAVPWGDGRWGALVGVMEDGKVRLFPPEAKGPEPRLDAREQTSLDMALGASRLGAGVGSSVDSCLDSSAIGGSGTAGGGQGIVGGSQDSSKPGSSGDGGIAGTDLDRLTGERAESQLCCQCGEWTEHCFVERVGHWVCPFHSCLCEPSSDSKESPTRGRSEEVRQDCTNSEHCQGIVGGSQGRSQPVNSRSHPGFQGQFCDDCGCEACGTQSCGCTPACCLNLRSHPRYEGQRCEDCGCVACGTRSCECVPACRLGLWSCGCYVTPSIHVETPRTTTASSGDGGQGIGIENAFASATLPELHAKQTANAYKMMKPETALQVEEGAEIPASSGDGGQGIGIENPDANANSQCIENPDANANSQCKQPASWLQRKREKAAAAAEARIPGQILGCLDTFEPRSAQGIKEQYAAKGIAALQTALPPEHYRIGDSDSDTDHGRNPPPPPPKKPHQAERRALHPGALHPGALHPDDIAGANDKGIAHSKLDAQIVCWT